MRGREVRCRDKAVIMKEEGHENRRVVKKEKKTRKEYVEG